MLKKELSVHQFLISVLDYVDPSSLPCLPSLHNEAENWGCIVEVNTNGLTDANAGSSANNEQKITSSIFDRKKLSTKNKTFSRRYKMKLNDNEIIL